MLRGTWCELRPYRVDDADALVRIADDFEVVRWLSHHFPHPYREVDARAWLAQAANESPTDSFAVIVAGTLAGGAGFRLKTGERAGVAEIGYWLGRNYWGRGIATEATRLLTTHAFGTRDLRRLEAQAFAPNVGSQRVLEKCGFLREGVQRSALVDRSGAVHDSIAYGLLRDDVDRA